MTVSLRILAAGYCHHPEAIVVKGGAWRQQKFPSTFAVIQHPEHGIILFDTGYTQRFFTETRPFPFRLYSWITPVCYQERYSAASQLERQGVSADMVRHIFISHFHADHIAGLRDFPSARFFCSEEAVRTLKPLEGWAALKQGFLKALLPADFENRCDYLESAPPIALDSAYSPFDSGFDLFGDESLIAIPLPGHHVGHYGLLAQTKEAPVFLVGDACWHQRSFEQGIGAHPMAGLVLKEVRVFNETIQKLTALHRKNPAIRIVPTHCPEMHQGLIEEQAR